MGGKKSWRVRTVRGREKSACKQRVLVFIIAGLAGGGALDAQVTQVNQGRALDSNPMVGGGGSNQPVQGYVPINGNDIMTGNVTGLSYFHGNIPYSSPYSFGVNLPSSTLGRFQAISSPLVAPTSNSQSIYRSYYLPSQSVGGLTATGTIAQPSPTGNGYNSNFGRVPYSNSVSDVSHPLWAPPVNNPLHPSNLDLPYRDYRDISVPQYGPTISNIYGLRQRAISPEDVLDPKTSEEDAAPTAAPAGGHSNLGGGYNEHPVASDVKDTTPKEYGDEPNTKMIRTDIGTRARVRGQETVKPMDLQVVGQPRGKPAEGFVGRTNTPVEKTATLTDESYAGLLAEINKNAEAQLTAAPKSASQQIVENPTWRIPQILDANGKPIPGRFGPLVPNRRPGETARGPGMLLEPGGGIAKGQHETPDKVQSDNPAAPGYRPKSYLKDEDPMNSREILQAGRKVATITTLAGKTKSTFNGIMRQAEDLMKKGDYLHAAEFYQGAISLEPENGLAVVGRANSQLAAGLYESAAYDLKFLFHRHPELMGVHYDLPAFMTQARLDFVTTDVRTLAHKGVQAACFLACYLDYQEQRQDSLVQDFADWFAHHPTDAWGPVVEKAWVEK